MKKSVINVFTPKARRFLAGLLCAVLVCGLIGPLSPLTGTAQAAHWAQKYINTLTNWGVMRDDIGDLDPDEPITRAELVTMINRAYGYTEMGPTPFKDIKSTDWFYEDICIGYTAGYIEGVSRTKADPLGYVTREQAVVFLARNMMLQEQAGEVTEFKDSRTLSRWSRGVIRSAVDAGIIEGFSDGSFKPQRKVTRGDMSCMLVKALGTLVKTKGVHSLGSVYGNVTVTSPGVTLRDTVIAGDLYLSAGIGLGDILLENVTVLGRIVDSGAGESEKGQSSIIMRNVRAEELIVDDVRGQFITLRAEGSTLVDTVRVRTSAYLEDVTPANLGLRSIQLEGKAGMQLQVAGNVKEVINRTPASTLQIAQGQANRVTVDEKAKGSSLSIARGASVGELNLDVGTRVSGDGDINQLNVGAAGSSVAMLPDKITVRPGLTANVAGETMNNVTAAESSEDPRLLALYPAVRNVAPTTADAVFSTNKRGTIYWALSAVADGSPTEADVISPPAYGSKILASGKINAQSSNTEYTAKLTKLTSDGKYYLTSVMVDSRGQHSPMKVIAFATPDDSTPAFATGYPVMSQITSDGAQVTVMTTKSCQLYYALLPKGAAAPTAAEFKAASITGNLGYGSMDAIKNTTIPFPVNSTDLNELTAYDLYLWLTDYNGAKSSKVTKLSFTTTDGTPPVVNNLRQTNAAATSATISFTVSEPATLYWVVVKEGDPFLQKIPGSGSEPEMEDLAAKTQVEAGVGAVKKGSVSASKADTEYTFNITGLKAETSYDLYYVAKDKAGNYSVRVEKLRPAVATLDNTPPTVTQEFDPYNGTNVNEPLADSNIRLVFSESVQGVFRNGSKWDYHVFADDYQAVLDAATDAARAEARQKLAEDLSAHITMYTVSSTSAAVESPVRTWQSDDASHAGDPWVIDFHYATVGLENGKMVITFPTDRNNKERSALNLTSGTTYRFKLVGIADTAIVPNRMDDITLPDFRTAFAQVAVNVGTTATIGAVDGGTVPKDGRIDFNFVVSPTSTQRVEDTMLWDMLIWTDTSMTYQLYSRKVADGKDAPWTLEGTKTEIVSGLEDGFAFSSLVNSFRTTGSRLEFEQVNEMTEDMEYAIHVTAIGDIDDSTAWNQRVTVKIMVVAGSYTGLTNLAGQSYLSGWETAQVEDGVSSIGQPDPRILRKQFTDTRAPNFVDNYPIISAGDVAAQVEVMLDRPGYVYYVAVPLTDLKDSNGDNIVIDGEIKDDDIDSIASYLCRVLPTEKDSKAMPLPKDVPTRGGTGDGTDTPNNWVYLSAPGVNTITGGRFTLPVRAGRTSERLGANVSATISLDQLQPNTIYYIYLLTQGTTAIYSDYARCIRFVTKEAVRPNINASVSGNGVNIEITGTPTADLDYILVLRGNENATFKQPFWGSTVSGTWTPSAFTDRTTVPSSYSSSMTVLEAMSTAYYEGGSYAGTVFDHYANTYGKNTIAGLIRTESVDGSDVVMKSSGRFTQANNNLPGNRVNCTGMIGTNYYTFLAVGKSTMGSGDAFRAVYPVRNRDTTAPMITAASLYVSEVDETDPTKVKTGTLTLTFNEELYVRTQDPSTGTQSTLPLDNCERLDPAHTSSQTYYALGNLVTSLASSGISVVTGKSTDTPSSHNVSISTITLELKDAKPGANISFRDTLCDQTGNIRQNNPLTVTLTYDSKTGQFGFTITSAWDGRASVGR